MPDETQAGLGAQGVTPGSALEGDILRMSDQAKRAQLAATKKNLGAAFGEGQPDTRAHQELATANIFDTLKEVDPNDPEAKIQALDKRAKGLEDEAQKILDYGVKTGHPNPTAHQTYLKAAAFVRAQARKLYQDWQDSLVQATQQIAQQQGIQPTSQPASQPASQPMQPQAPMQPQPQPMSPALQGAGVAAQAMRRY
jgi:hypothetical protein